jgi:hypothetical protein
MLQRWHINATLPRGIQCHATFIFATAWKIRATFCQGGKFQCHATFIFATVWQIRATIATFNAKKVAYQCHPTAWHSMPRYYIFFANTWKFRATIVEFNATIHLFLPPIEIGGKIFAGRPARCPLRLATSRKGLMLILSELILEFLSHLFIYRIY